MNWWKKHEFQLLVLCVCLGAVLRAGYLVEIKKIPFFDHPVGDARIYFDRALQILDGKLFPEEVSFHSSPVYPYFIAVTYWLGGNSLLGTIVVQMLSGLASVVILFLIVRQSFGIVPALLAALFMSVYPQFIHLEGDLMMISLVVCAFNASCLMGIYYQESRKRKFIIWWGIFLGLAVLGKPDLVMVAPFCAGWILVTEHTIRDGFLRACIFGLFVFLTILPLTITNYLLTKEFLLLTSNGGVNFYIGNHKGADGMFHLPPDSGLWDHKLYISSKETAEQALGRHLTPSEVSRFWFNRAMNFIIDHPFEFLRLTGKKCLLMINQFEVSNHHSFYFFEKYSSILKYNPFRLSFFIFFGFAGIICSVLNWRRVILIYLYAGVTFMITALFFVTARYRLPTVTFFILFAAYGIYELWNLAVHRRWKKLIIHSVPAGILCALSLVKFPEFNYFPNQDYNNLGNVYTDLKMYDKALRCYNLVLKNNPNTTFVHFNIGNVYYDQGKTEMAVSEFIKEIELNPKFSSSYFNCAKIYIEKGNLEQARIYLEKMTHAEFDLQGMINLAYVYFTLGKIDKAIGVYTELCNRYPGNSLFREQLALCYKKLENSAVSIPAKTPLMPSKSPDK